MIRRDYILRMIEEFAEALARLKALKQGKRWEEATGALDEEFRKLAGDSPERLIQLSETDLLARVMQEGPTQLVHEKMLMLTRLFTEAGEVATASDRHAEGTACYLKALHLLLMVLAEGDVFEFPDFVPKIEMLRSALAAEALPLHTNAMLMQYYERSGEFARAEDSLFAMLESEPRNQRIIELGIGFYGRLLNRPDAELASANLPRTEVEEGLKELRAKL